MTNTQINSAIKKQVISLMGKGQESYKTKLVRNDELFTERKVTITYESTCEIGKHVDYKLIAIFDKYEETIKLIQL